MYSTAISIQYLYVYYLLVCRNECIGYLWSNQTIDLSLDFAYLFNTFNEYQITWRFISWSLKIDNKMREFVDLFVSVITVLFFLLLD